ncbi:hypothetical protein ASG89_29090 [Paenibacillus sp. Soil766]|uniref:DUF6470 family protein n=1 Tax=Paenibacillus sp. Soil766 TaxID=1736404 RepID=UPI000708BA98|nr:DUF6470 family protein [Paenibacillus sp. Soil766]KRE97961.1 hypothetical protein ASG89_29090 [Paenibacillus sp. Soil766]
MPVVQLRQTYARLGIDADLGQQSIRQPRPDFQITTRMAQLDATYRKGDLTIDQSRSWEALGKGNVFQFTALVANEAKSLALQGIAKRVEIGNRLAAIHNGGNPIADMAADNFFEDFKFNYEGPFSTDSVDIQYRANRPEVNYEPGSVDIQSKTNSPEISYTPGKLDIYLAQKNSIEMIPPQLDLKV